MKESAGTSGMKWRLEKLPLSSVEVIKYHEAVLEAERIEVQQEKCVSSNS